MIEKHITSSSLGEKILFGYFSIKQKLIIIIVIPYSRVRLLMQNKLLQTVHISEFLVKNLT